MVRQETRGRSRIRTVARGALLLFGLAALLLLVTIPVSAVPANPDSITLHTVKVFQNIFEANDVLFVTSYDVEYTNEPTEPASATFEIAILDGTTLVQRRSLNYYQYNIQSVYFNAADAASLTWGKEYKVRVQGTPTYFTLTENVTMDTITLSSSHWISGTMTESRELLKLHCISLAATLEDVWNIVLLVTTTTGQVLNSTGRITFLDAIPELDSAVPDLFQVATSTVAVTKQTRTAAYEEQTTIGNMLGTQIKAAFDGVGDYLNISGEKVAFLWIMLFALVVASIVFLSTSNTVAAMVLTIPILLIGAWTGALPLAVLFTLVAIVVIFTGYHIWLRGL